jgi:uracil-DNA glycosylase
MERHMETSMKKRPRSAETLPLFSDLDVALTLQHRETLSVPENDSLELILADLRESPICGACRGGMPIIFGIGSDHAQLMLIGEGAGIDDVETRLPFQGQAGILLNKMMAAIHVPLRDCYVCNVIKCIPPGERNFSTEEIEDCRHFLLRQILTVKPRVIVAFGALAAQTLLRTQTTISALRGRAYTLVLNDHEMSLVPTFNPAYILRVVDKKREAWEDLKLIRDLISG